MAEQLNVALNTYSARLKYYFFYHHTELVSNADRLR